MANLDALLRIRTDVQGANGIVALNRGLQGVQQSAAGASVAMRGMAGSSALLTSSLGALLPLMSAAGLVGLVKGAIDAGDAMNDLSQRTGVSVEALAKFKKAAATSGTDIDNVAKSLGRLSKGMFEAATTGKGKAADALNALGISAKDAAGNIKSADAVTIEIANRFKAMPDGVTKTALAMALFGKSGADMIPMLNMGGAAIDSLSVKMTKAFAEQADEYRDKLAILSGKVSALGMDLTIALLPALNAVTDAVTAAVAGFNSLPPGLQQATVAAAALAIAWGPLTSAVKLGGVAIKSTGAAMEVMRYQAALAGGVMPLLAGGLDAVKVAILGIPGWGWALAGVAALTALTAYVYKTNDAFRDFVGNLGDVISGDFKNAMQAMGNFAAGAGRFISGTWSKLVGFAQQVGSGIAQAFSGPFGFIADAARTAMGLVSGAIQNMVNAIPKPIRDKLGMAVGQAATGALFGPIGSYAIGAVGRAMSMGPRAGGAQGGGGGGGIAAPAAEALDLSGYGGAGGRSAGAGRAAGGGGRNGFQLSSQGKALVAAAAKLGVSPLDLATIIGFETGGSYSPSQRGGAGGNYMGLIQFGGPERRQYGANAGQSFEEQVQGPVVRYFQDRFRGAGMSTQGATLEDLYTTVLAGNPRANRNSRDSFGTSPRSGVAAMGPHRQESLRRFFGGSMANVGYGADDAGKDAAQGFEDQRRIAEEQKKQAEETQKQLTSARDLLATSEARLQVAAAMDPLEKAQVEYDQARTERMREYAEKYANVRSAQEGELLVAAQINGWALAKLELDKKMADIADQQLITERQRAEALADSMAYMQEMTSRTSVGAGLQQGLQGYVDSIGTMRDAVGQLTTDSIGGLESSLAELATTGTTNFKVFAASVLADTSRRIIRQMVLKTIMSLIGGIGGGAGRSFEMPGQAFIPSGGYSFAGGGYTGNGSRSGGLDGQGGFMAMLHPRETVIDHTRGTPRAAAAGGNAITINVDASGTKAEGNAGTGAALARDLARVVDDRLIHHRRPGGLLAA
jgi:lambda family phage tail tape measure protein